VHILRWKAQKEKDLGFEVPILRVRRQKKG
jgi:hypothetical protein